jgi:hypothetical protein
MNGAVSEFSNVGRSEPTPPAGPLDRIISVGSKASSLTSKPSQADPRQWQFLLFCHRDTCNSLPGRLPYKVTVIVDEFAFQDAPFTVAGENASESFSPRRSMDGQGTSPLMFLNS